MKKLILLFAALAAASLSLNAQTPDEIVAKIEKANHPDIESRFEEKRSFKSAPGQNYAGKLTFRNPDALTLKYDDASEGFQIDASKVSITHQGKTAVFDATKNLMMKSLSHALIYAFQGRITELVAEQDTSLEVAREGNMCCVTLNALKKSARGYKSMVINYSAKDCGIRSMRLDEFTGVSTFYELK